ncbi:MAG: PASTA domain-containing protein [Elusimicrobiota bacterium]
MKKNGLINKTVIEVIIVTIAFLGVTFWMFNTVMDALIHYKTEVKIPSITGKSLTGAMDVLTPLKLGLIKVGEQFDDKYPANTVIRQIPDAGTTIKEGRVLQVILSKGGQSVFVPNLMGETVRSAELLLRRAGLGLGEELQGYSNTQDKGKIISQDPVENDAVGKGELVNIVVSIGRPPEGTVLLPNFNGKNVVTAKKWCDDNSVEFGIEFSNSSGAEKDIVISQIPRADTVVSEGLKVRLILSLGNNSSVEEKK